MAANSDGNGTLKRRSFIGPYHPLHGETFPANTKGNLTLGKCHQFTGCVSRVEYRGHPANSDGNGIIGSGGHCPIATCNLSAYPNGIRIPKPRAGRAERPTLGFPPF